MVLVLRFLKQIELFTVARTISKLLKQANPVMVMAVERLMVCRTDECSSFRAPNNNTANPSINIAALRQRIDVERVASSPKSSTKATGVKNNWANRNTNSSDVPIVAIL